MVSTKEIILDSFIRFRKKTHQYFSINNNEYKPVSKILNETIREPFDSKGISTKIAIGEANRGEISKDMIEQRAKDIRNDWKKKKNDSSYHGNRIHKIMEDYLSTGICKEKEYEAQINKMLEYVDFHNQHTVMPEKMLYSIKHKIAGTADIVTLRQKSSNTLMDLFDHKTNIEKGIKFNSIGSKKYPNKNYNRFMKEPFHHLEDCNYNQYALQLSIYALLAQLTYDIRIGRLAIIYFPKKTNNMPIYYPVPFMKNEAKILLDMNDTKGNNENGNEYDEEIL